MSFISTIKAAAERVVCVESPSGALYARLRRPTVADAITSGATALVVPDDPAARERAKARDGLRSPAAKAELQLASITVQRKIVAACVVEVGPTEAGLEPVTLIVEPGDVARPGTEALPVDALLPEWVAGLAAIIWNEGEWRQRAASFRSGDAGGAGGGGEGVRSAADDAA